MAIFAEVIKLGSFRQAAKTLKLSPSVVSYHISQLEARIGTPLIYRSTRKLSLTNQGETFYQHVLTMLSAARHGLDEIAQGHNQLTGKVSISLPTALIKAPITKKLAAFANQHKKIQLSISYTDEREDIFEKGIDIAIRAGELPDSSLKAKTIGYIERILVASSDYYNQHPMPIAPQNLSSWQWIKLAMLPSYREFIHDKHANIKIHFNHQITVNNVDAMTQLCLLSCGLATPANYQVDELLQQEKLVHVLPQWKIAPKPLYAVWPANISEHGLAKTLVNYLTSNN